jgi:flavin-dependent dehydrogenase
MQAHDVLIVGGGPAGSSCARGLVQAGLDVLILDKAQFPRDKVCAGWITPAVVQELELDLAEYARGRVLQPITGFRVGLLGGTPVTVIYDRPVSYGIRRCEFDDFLLRRSGATLRLGEGLASLRRDGDLWIANDAIAAPLVIGAGGHFCPVARMFSDKGDDKDIVVLAQECEFPMPAEAASRCEAQGLVPELYFCDDLKGYAWCFRKGDYLNIGLGREGETRLSAQVEAFYRRLEEDGRIPRDLSPRFHGHAYRLRIGPTRVVTQPGILLIGDSAGLAYPQSGEGIRPAVESGLIAAGLIAESPRSEWNGLAPRIQRRLTSRFGPPGRHSSGASRMPPRWKTALARQLLANRWFARHILINRWFLHRHQPPLAFRDLSPRAPSHSAAT